MLVHENFHQISQCSSTTASSYVCITSLFEVDPRHCCQCVELSFSTFETDLKPFCFISNIKGRLAGHGAIAPVLLQVFIIITISQSMIEQWSPSSDVQSAGPHITILSSKLFCYHLVILITLTTILTRCSPVRWPSLSPSSPPSPFSSFLRSNKVFSGLSSISSYSYAIMIFTQDSPSTIPLS